MGREVRNLRVDAQRGARARQMVAVVALIALLAIAILALAGARRTVLGQEPKACHEISAPLAGDVPRC
jgi:Tfp pilus assembly protein PilX